jgi:hypothetical protein
VLPHLPENKESLSDEEIKKVSGGALMIDGIELGIALSGGG